MRIGTYDISSSMSLLSKITSGKLGFLRMKSIASLIKKNDLDIVCIQNAKGLTQMVMLVLFLMSYDCIVSPAGKGRKNAILYKTKKIKLLKDLPGMLLSAPCSADKAFRSACRGIFRIKGDTKNFEVVSLATSPYSKTKIEQAVNIVANNFDFLNTYVAGNFNIPGDSDDYKVLMSKFTVLGDCCKKPSLVDTLSNGQLRRENYILTQKSFAKKMRTEVAGDYSLADHLMVITETV